MSNGGPNRGRAREPTRIGALLHLWSQLKEYFSVRTVPVESLGRQFDDYHPPESSVRFMEELVAEVPELKGLHDEHLHCYDEMLPHPLMSDVARFVESLVQGWGRSGGDTSRSRDVVARILDFLERGLTTRDGDIAELILDGFLPPVAYGAPGYEEVKALMGPMLREELEWGWEPEPK